MRFSVSFVWENKIPIRSCADHQIKALAAVDRNKLEC